jgi:inhibitor of KinA
MSQQLIYRKFGEQAILLSWGDSINHDVSADIALFNKKILTELSEYIIETVTAFCSLTVYVKQGVDQNKVITILKKSYHSKDEADAIKPKIWDIPVCYDPTLGIDIEGVAKQKQMSVEKLIKYHSQVKYTVDFLGFLPGFPYLSGLNPLLFTKRLQTPRLSVAKGSVAIGGNQTGVYPISSPGGWHIIGRTSVDFFNVNNNPICFIKPVDIIKFTSISLEEFHNG